MIDANIEGYRAIRNAGHAILPETDEAFESAAYRKTCFRFFKLMCATCLGKICASDHAMNAVEDMSVLNRDLKSFFDQNGASYPVWQTLEKEALREYGVTGVDGIVLDLGVSSYQLDTEDRGFSYRFDAHLDMRMDRRQTLTARDIVNNYSEMELYHIIRDYGEDPFAKNIAKHIVKNRADKPIETTFELNEIIKAAVPAKMRQNGHPSKQTFQAIRIECNQELEVLKKALDELIDLLNPGGRFCIITFHSLEDRIVKNAFRRNENPCTCPPEFPVCVCGKVSKGKVITRKPILPSVEELEVNSRSKSAKLRVFEKK